MTGSFVPVGILNPIRAVVGIPIIDSTFSSKCSSGEQHDGCFEKRERPFLYEEAVPAADEARQ